MQQVKEHTKIVLASASPRRVEMLKNLGLTFTTIAADVDETVLPGLLPSKVVSDLALAKALKVQSFLQDKSTAQNNHIDTPDGDIVIIAADTIVAEGAQILGKPTDRADAVNTLQSLSGKAHQVFTGVCILHLDDKFNTISTQNFVDTADVTFRQLGKAEIENYVDTGEPMDKAGSYALQGIGAFLVQSIKGCPANVKGLPVPLLVQKLRALGLPVMGQ